MFSCAAGYYGTAETELSKAVELCEDMASKGLSQDAYVDIAGCVNDRVGNSLKGGLHDPQEHIK